MKIEWKAKPLVFNGDDGQLLSVYADNQGEPYREGVRFLFESNSRTTTSVMLDYSEIKQLRDKLGEFLGG
jgi:hypothetical protein